MRPGKNRDGYFTTVEVEEQAKAAIAIVKDVWPDYDHVFVYDNTTTHKKRAEGALSARGMPMNPSGSRSKKHADANLLLEATRRDQDGKPVYDSSGHVIKDKIKMTGATFAD